MRVAKTPIPELAALKAGIRRCTRCAALVRCRSCVVPGDGDAPARVAFVGIAPGRRGGDRTGIPFRGDRSGDLLRRMIARAGLKNVFITNLVRCNPRDARGRNRDPAAREIANCREHLERELEIVRPRIIVCLGRLAWRELAGRGTAFSPGLADFPVRGDAIVYPLYHPAYVNRGAYPERDYLRDFRRLARFAQARSVNRELTEGATTAMLMR
jgi:DNA polymerase